MGLRSRARFSDMQLPPNLRQALAQATAQVPLAALSDAAQDLSQRYRAQTSSTASIFPSDVHRLAYAAVRMPATFAAVCAVLAEMARLMPAQQIESMLDLGAGPGTAAWAACDVFPALQEITLLERDHGLITLGKRLAQEAAESRLSNANWHKADLRTQTAFPTADLVLCSYALGELSGDAARQVWQLAWQAARHTLVIVEPGTMKGFALLRTVRQALIAAGGYLCAPCPHTAECPLSAEEWCHFAARVERTALHRRLKAGALGHEDEKFSYLVFSKQPLAQAKNRVLRHPQRRPNFVQLQLCTEHGLETLSVTHKDKEIWKRARKIDWGAAWE